MSDYNGTLQTGVDVASEHMKHNTKNFNNFSYFLQGIDVTQQNLDQMTPYVPGVARFFMHTTPYFMANQYPEMTTNFKSYIETAYKSVEGIGDLDASFIDIEGGFAAQKFSNISSVTDSTDEITVQLYEQTGSPVREYLETWMTGARDPRSGIAHYHGGIDAGIEYSEKYHTAEFVFYDLDPTARKIEYACMFAHAFPTKVGRSHLNYTSGSRGEVVMDVSFKVTKYEGQYINDLAAYYLIKDKLTYNYLKFNPYKDGGMAESVNSGYALTLGETT